MALHTQLRIYRPALDLTKLASRLVSHMSRNYRAVDGAMLVGHTRAVLHEIRLANKAPDKVPHLNRILDELSDIEIDLEVLTDLREISPSGYADAALLAKAVGRQAMGWRKSLLPDSRPSRRP